MKIRRGIFLAVALVAAKACAQNMLYVEHKGQMYPVRKAVESRPYVRYDGKLVPASGERFSLYKTGEYLPILLDVKDVRVASTSYEFVDSGATLNNQFELRADFSSAYDLDDVFLVLDLTLEGGKKYIYLREIGHLEPNKSRWLKVDVQLVSQFGRGSYQMHLFAGGDELLNSQQSESERNAIMDAMVEKRVAKIQDAPPKLFAGPAPLYPKEMRKAKVKGRAVVRFRILANGITANPVLLNATDPAFGESAVNAIRQWRFLPKIEQGRAKETEVEMPFAFSPPNEPEA